MNRIRWSLANGIRRTRRLSVSSTSHSDPNNPQLFYPSQPSIPYRPLPYNLRALSNDAYPTTGWTGEAMIADAREAKEAVLVELEGPHRIAWASFGLSTESLLFFETCTEPYPFETQAVRVG